MAISVVLLLLFERKQSVLMLINKMVIIDFLNNYSLLCVKT